MALTAAGAFAQPAADPASPASYAPIDPAAHVRRSPAPSPPTRCRAAPPAPRARRRTIAWLTEQFRALGLQPGGENGGWTQRVPLIRTQLAPAPDRDPHPARRDPHASKRRATSISARCARWTGSASTNAPLVFVGYGVTAPERSWNDFGDADLTGAIAVFLVNDPDFEAAAGEPVASRFGGRAMTYYGRWTYKFEEAARRGAIGALVIHETEGAGYGWNTVQAPAGENYNVVLGAGARQPVLLQGWLQREQAVDLFRRAGRDFEAVRRAARSAASRPINLDTTLSADIPVTVRAGRKPQRHRPPARPPPAERDDHVRRPLGRLWRRPGRREWRHDPQRRA